MAEVPTLVFFDTISHVASELEKINLDLIQFPKPLIIRDLRIIPTGTKVDLDVPGGSRLGNTSPSSFKVELFVNNLSQNGASSFQKLGDMRYDSESSIRFIPKVQIPTDGLILKGSYVSITVAVIAEAIKEENSTLVASNQPRKSTVDDESHYHDRPKLHETSTVGGIPKIILAPSHAPAQLQVKAVHPRPISTVVTAQPSPTQSVHIGASIQQIPTHPGLPPQSVLPVPMMNISSIQSLHQPAPGTSAVFPTHMPPPNYGLPPPTHSSFQQPPPNLLSTGQFPTAAAFDPTRPPPMIQPLAPVAVDQMSHVSDIQVGKVHSPVASGTPVVPANVPVAEQKDKREKDRQVKDRLKVKSDRTESESSGGDRKDQPKPLVGRSPKCDPNLEEGVTVVEGTQGITKTFQSGQSDTFFREYSASDDEDKDSRLYAYETISDEEFEVTEIIDPDLYEKFNEDFLNATTNQFNVHQFEIPPLMFFKPPYCSEFELERLEVSAKCLDDEIPETAQKIIGFLSDYANDEPHDEKWVECLEQLAKLVIPGLVYIIENAEYTGIVDTLVDWTVEACDFELAAKQKQPVFILRHMKAGIRLATVLGSSIPEISTKLLAKFAHLKLMELFNGKFTCIPIKLLILKALDAMSFFHCGLETFVSGRKSPGGNLYQLLIEAVANGQPSRVICAIAPLVNKLHFYEGMESLTESLKSVLRYRAEYVQTVEVTTTASGEAMDEETNKDDVPVAESDLNIVLSSLREIVRLLRNADALIAQPKKNFLPVQAVFDSTSVSRCAEPSLYQMFDCCNVLENVFVLCSTPPLSSDPEVLSLVEKFLKSLIGRHSGLLYLTAKSEISRGIIRLLIGPLSTEEQSEHDNGDEFPLQSLGIEVAYHIQALHHVDELMHFHGSGVAQLEVDNLAVMNSLHNLYTLTSGPSGLIGQSAVVNLLSYEHNLRSLLPFVEMTGDNDWDSRMRKSACTGYASELLLTAIRNSNSVEMLQRFSEKLLQISSQEVTSKIAEVRQWVEVLRKLPTFNYEAVPYLAERIKAFAHEGVAPKLPKGLITLLRILKHVCIAPMVDEGIEIQEQLKYKYAVMQFFALDGYFALITIVEKLSEAYMYRWQQGLSLNSRAGRLVLATILPAVCIIRATLSYLIQCRGTDFKDISAVKPLLQLYTVCCTLVPPNGVLPETCEVQSEVIKALLAFTQPDLSQLTTADSDFEVVSESLWTLMVGEIIQFSISSPYCFIGGLSCLCELLPLQLPLQSKEGMSEAEVQLAVNSRHRWSAHLLPLTGQIQEMIKQFSGTTFPPLQNALRRGCIQLSDLSPPMALAVAQALLDVLLDFASANARPSSKDISATLTSAASLVEASGLTGVTEADKPASEKPIWTAKPLATVELAHSLNLVSSLINSHPPIKIAVLSLLVNSQPDEDYSHILKGLLTVLNYAANETAHLSSQECIVSIISSLCDESITLFPSDSDIVTLEQLSWSIPPKTILSQLCVALLRHLGNTEQSFATVLPSLRTLNCLLFHDYGLYHIKRALEVEDRCLMKLLGRLDSSFSRDSSDCLSTLSTLLDFLKMLVDTPHDCQEELRSLRVESSIARQVLEWNCGADANLDHPITRLAHSLENSKEDESLGPLLENIKKTIEMLNGLDNNEASLTENVSVESQEAAIPPFPSLQDQWGRRQIWICPSEADEDRLISPYFLPAMTLEEDEDVMEDKTNCDLEALRLRYFTHYDLKAEILQRVSMKNTEDTSTTRRKPRQVIINTGRQGGDNRKPFKEWVAPMRGRGFVPRGQMNSRPHDPFRSRPPNTSRPPSMHVDDFLKIEHTGVPTPPAASITQTTSRGGQRDSNTRGNKTDGIVRGNRPVTNYGNGRGGRGSYGSKTFASPISKSGATRSNYPSSYDRPRERSQKSPRIPASGDRSRRPRHRSNSR